MYYGIITLIKKKFFYLVIYVKTDIKASEFILSNFIIDLPITQSNGELGDD